MADRGCGADGGLPASGPDQASHRHRPGQRPALRRCHDASRHGRRDPHRPREETCARLRGHDPGCLPQRRDVQGGLGRLRRLPAHWAVRGPLADRERSLGAADEGCLMEHRVEFSSQGATLRGLLYLPRAAARRPPIVVMAHGFSATTDGMVADRYAVAFCDAGLAVLLYDHRGFGGSGGEPRVRAVVTQVPACGDAPPPPDPADAVVETMAGVYASRRLRPASGPVEGPMPVVAADQLATPSALTPLTAFRWFMEYGGRYGTGWQNWVTAVTRDRSEPYQPVLCAA